MRLGHSTSRATVDRAAGDNGSDVCSSNAGTTSSRTGGGGFRPWKSVKSALQKKKKDNRSGHSGGPGSSVSAGSSGWGRVGRKRNRKVAEAALLKAGVHASSSAPKDNDDDDGGGASSSVVTTTTATAAAHRLFRRLAAADSSKKRNDTVFAANGSSMTPSTQADDDEEEECNDNQEIIFSDPVKEERKNNDWEEPAAAYSAPVDAPPLFAKENNSNMLLGEHFLSHYEAELDTGESAWLSPDRAPLESKEGAMNRMGQNPASDDVYGGGEDGVEVNILRDKLWGTRATSARDVYAEEEKEAVYSGFQIPPNVEPRFSFDPPSVATGTVASRSAGRSVARNTTITVHTAANASSAASEGVAARRRRLLARRVSFGMEEEEGCEIIFFQDDDDDDWRSFPREETAVRTEKVEKGIFLSFRDMGFAEIADPPEAAPAPFSPAPPETLAHTPSRNSAFAATKRGVAPIPPPQMDTPSTSLGLAVPAFSTYSDPNDVLLAEATPVRRPETDESGLASTFAPLAAKRRVASAHVAPTTPFSPPEALRRSATQETPLTWVSHVNDGRPLREITVPAAGPPEEVDRAAAALTTTNPTSPARQARVNSIRNAIFESLVDNSEGHGATAGAAANTSRIHRGAFAAAALEESVSTMVDSYQLTSMDDMPPPWDATGRLIGRQPSDGDNRPSPRAGELPRKEVSGVLMGLQPEHALLRSPSSESEIRLNRNREGPMAFSYPLPSPIRRRGSADELFAGLEDTDMSSSTHATDDESVGLNALAKPLSPTNFGISSSQPIGVPIRTSLNAFGAHAAMDDEESVGLNALSSPLELDACAGSVGTADFGDAEAGPSKEIVASLPSSKAIASVQQQQMEMTYFGRPPSPSNHEPAQDLSWRDRDPALTMPEDDDDDDDDADIIAPRPSTHGVVPITPWDRLDEADGESYSENGINRNKMDHVLLTAERLMSPPSPISFDDTGFASFKQARLNLGGSFQQRSEVMETESLVGSTTTTAFGPGCHCFDVPVMLEKGRWRRKGRNGKGNLSESKNTLLGHCAQEARDVARSGSAPASSSHNNTLRSVVNNVGDFARSTSENFRDFWRRRRTV